MEQRQELLTVEHLTKSYDGKGKALHDVSLSLGRGEFVTVIGPSGAGKSTFLRCINRLIDASEGSIEFDGREITSMNKRQMRKVRRDIGMIFQHYNDPSTKRLTIYILNGGRHRSRMLPCVWPSFRDIMCRCTPIRKTKKENRLF